MTSEFRREIQFQPGYDHRNDPDPEKSKYGAHGMNIRFLLHGEKATMQFLLFTGWLPTWERFETRTFGPLPADLGYHADEPQYEDHGSLECDCRPNKVCYYDGSGLQADVAFRALITKGEDAMWEVMEEHYNLWIKK